MDQFNPNFPINTHIHTCDIPSYIVVHGGQFHADELLAVSILDIAYDYGRNGTRIPVTRTRDQAVISKDDKHINVDVGGKYNGTNFDHHQRDYNGPMWVREDGTKFRMSSCGQVWRSYGVSVVARVMNIADDDDPHVDDIENCMEAVNRISKILASIDAVDNGSGHLFVCDPNLPNLATILSAFNVYGEEGFDKARNIAYEWLNATIRKVIEAVEYEFEVYVALRTGKNKPILELLIPGPWVNVYCKDPDAFSDYQVALYKAGEDDWRVQTIPDTPDNPQSMRCPAPEAIRGLRGKELADITGVPDAVFVHPAGFTGGARTVEGAMNLARWWIANHMLSDIQKNDA